MYTFLSTSRYKTATSTKEDDSAVVISARKPIYGTNYYLYVSKETDTFDLLATRVLGNPALWWKVADLNPHVPFPDQIPVGTTIRLPRP